MIRKALLSDLGYLTELALLLWPEHEKEEMAQELSETMCSDESAVFLCEIDTRAIALGICQLRHDYVEGTKTNPVGYLEGIYVREEYRRNGVAKGLLECCEQWAKENGCTEFASDCELTNEKSIAFHNAAGFSEANRIVCFTKTI